MSDIKSGAMVFLRTGSPLMTVVDKNGSKCTCIWFDANKIKHCLYDIHVNALFIGVAETDGVNE